MFVQESNTIAPRSFFEVGMKWEILPYTFHFEESLWLSDRLTLQCSGSGASLDELKYYAVDRKACNTCKVHMYYEYFM